MPSLTQSIHEIAETRKTDLLLHLVESDPELDTVLVIVRTKDTLHELSTALSQAEIPASSLHGGTKPELRDRAVRELKEGHLRVLVVLEAIARAIDIDGIRHIIQFNFHEIADDYLTRLDAIQKSKGTITTFVAPKEKNLLNKLNQLAGEDLPSLALDGFNYSPNPAGPKNKGPRRPQSKPLQHKKPKLRNGGRDNKKSKRTKKR